MTQTDRRLVHDPEALNTAVWPTPSAGLLTPVEQFFTRSHAPVPELDARRWRLEVGGLVDRPATLSLEQIERAYPPRDVTATMVCAGLRRSEFLRLGPLPGELPWGPEPISTGHWAGVGLADLLRDVGVSAGARHVQFIGLDRCERLGRQFGFGGSIHLTKALAGDVLLATRLNGEPLPPAHGYPVRVVVPGWAGVRSVKWLARIELAAEPSSNYFQTRAYRVQRERNALDPRDVSAGEAIEEVPLNAVILEPGPGSTVPAGPLAVRGWALGTAGSAITSVEVSPDDGCTWHLARQPAEATPWSWVFWDASVVLPPGCHTVVARATDALGHTQPATLDATWNVKGYNNNAWYRVAVRAV